jgi:hypothetical protein
MSQRWLGFFVALSSVMWPAIPVSAQTSAAVAPATRSSWTPAKTPDGVPDLQGVWTNQTNQPLERPRALGRKEFYTTEEMAERAKDTGPAKRTSRFGESEVHYDSAQFGVDRAHAKMGLSNRTSIIIGPEGRLPPLLPEAKKLLTQRNAARSVEHEFDGPESRTLSERCIIWPGEGPPMLPQGYNSNLQIVQGPGYIAIEQEMIHDVRVIPTVSRPHVPANIRSYLGDSRGHWEGNTLVVDTTNFKGPVTFRDFEASQDLHVVERFTRTSEDTITYRFTVTDPSTWEESWSGELPITRIEGQVYEYACQEGNYGILNILSGARAADAEAASKRNVDAGELK